MTPKVPTSTVTVTGVNVEGCNDCPFRDDSFAIDGHPSVCRLTGRQFGVYPYTTGAWETCPLKHGPAVVALLVNPAKG
jgi:hypothetical protein